jgi:hypothetical protein
MLCARWVLFNVYGTVRQVLAFSALPLELFKLEIIIDYRTSREKFRCPKGFAAFVDKTSLITTVQQGFVVHLTPITNSHF